MGARSHLVFLSGRFAQSHHGIILSRNTKSCRLRLLGINIDTYYSGLVAYGVRSVDSLMQLTMQDYGVVGVHSMDDRKRLY